MRAVAALAVMSCGRIGFDAQPGAGGAYVVSATQLVPPTGVSFVDLDVDWTRSLAYTGTREPGYCWDVIDFSATPSFVARVAPPTTSGTGCLGVSLDASGTALVVTSSVANTVERWDLGADPRAASYTRQATVTAPDPRRLRRSLADPAVVLTALGRSPPGFQVLHELTASPWLTAGGSYASALACPDQLDGVIDLATNVVLTPCSTNDSPVEIVDLSSLTLVGQIPAVPAAGESGFDAIARSADGKLGVALGWVSVVVDASGGTDQYAMRARFDNDSAYRDARFIDRGRGPEVVAVRADDAVEILSLADPANPVVVASGALGVGSELYALSVAPDNQRAIVVNNRGWFVVVDLTALPPADLAWPSF